MKSYSKLLQALLLASVVNPAWSHSGLSHANTLFSGFIHPLSGADHLLVMFAVGLYAGFFKWNITFLITASFLLFMALGSGIAIFYKPLFAIENGIILSLFGVGILLNLMNRTSQVLAFPLLAFFGFCHGYAHASEINPGDSSLTYQTGFLLSTALFVTLGIFANRLNNKKLTLISVVTGMTSIMVGALAIAN
jgi:urease accessory protein